MSKTVDFHVIMRVYARGQGICLAHCYLVALEGFIN